MKKLQRLLGRAVTFAASGLPSVRALCLILARFQERDLEGEMLWKAPELHWSKLQVQRCRGRTRRKRPKQAEMRDINATRTQEHWRLRVQQQRSKRARRGPARRSREQVSVLRQSFLERDQACARARVTLQVTHFIAHPSHWGLPGSTYVRSQYSSCG
jgi:hypothetical protein